MDRSITLQETTYVNMVQLYIFSYSIDLKLQCMFIIWFFNYIIFDLHTHTHTHKITYHFTNNNTTEKLS